MRSSTTTALDDLFADDPDEIVERVLLAYQPLLSRTVLTRLQVILQDDLAGHVTFAPWRLDDDAPPRALGPLTAGQVALLGGTLPRRILREVAVELDLPVDGDVEGERTVSRMGATTRGVHDLVDRYVAPEVEGRADRAHKIRAFVELAVAAEYASLMGALVNRHGSLLTDPDEEPELVGRQFHGAVEVFRKLRLTGEAQRVFLAHFVDDHEIEHIAEDEGRSVDKEAERLDRFLRALAQALAQAVGGPGGEASTGKPLPGAKPARALSPGAGRGARRRTRSRARSRAAPRSR